MQYKVTQEFIIEAESEEEALIKYQNLLNKFEFEVQNTEIKERSEA